MRRGLLIFTAGAGIGWLLKRESPPKMDLDGALANLRAAAGLVAWYNLDWQERHGYAPLPMRLDKIEKHLDNGLFCLPPLFTEPGKVPFRREHQQAPNLKPESEIPEVRETLAKSKVEYESVRSS